MHTTHTCTYLAVCSISSCEHSLRHSGIPYIYVPSKFDLGAAASTKRPTSVVLVSPADSFKVCVLMSRSRRV
jgi:ribosomal protein L7Ae-like RNA K-turn-binding protein